MTTQIDVFTEMLDKMNESLEKLRQAVAQSDHSGAVQGETEILLYQPDREKYENELFAVRFAPSLDKKGNKPWYIQTRSSKGVVGKRFFGTYRSKIDAVARADELRDWLAEIGVTEVYKAAKKPKRKNTELNGGTQ